MYKPSSILMFLVLLAGCSASPQCAEIDDAYVLTFLMQWQLEPSNNLKVSTLAEPKSVITEPKVQPSLEGATSLRIEIPFLSETTVAASDGANASVGAEPASLRAPKTVALPATDPAAVQVKKPPFYEIILHTGDNCATCDVLKHELKIRGIPFKEHRVKSGTVPVAWIDGVEYIGASKIYKRLEIQRTK